jgi:hypothetical protein
MRRACPKIGQDVPNKEAENLTIAEYILRRWALSGDAKSQERFSEIAFGKIPQPLLSSGGEGIEGFEIVVVGGRATEEEIRKRAAELAIKMVSESDKIVENSPKTTNQNTLKA